MSRFFSPPFPEDGLACLCAEETRLLNLGGEERRRKGQNRETAKVKAAGKNEGKKAVMLEKVVSGLPSKGYSGGVESHSPILSVRALTTTVHRGAGTVAQCRPRTPYRTGEASGFGDSPLRPMPMLVA